MCLLVPIAAVFFLFTCRTAFHILVYEDVSHAGSFLCICCKRKSAHCNFNCHQWNCYANKESDKQVWGDKVLFMRAFLCVIVFSLASFRPLNAEVSPARYGVIDWFPFGWVEDGKNKGMFVEIVASLDAALKVQSEVVVAPVPRILRGMQRGEYDFTITYRDNEMMEQVNYLVDIGCLKAAVVSLRKQPVRALKELNGLRVAYPGGGYFVKRFLPELRLDGLEVSQTDIMFRMALRGRLDAFIINDAVWQGYRNNLFPGFRVPQERWIDFAEPLYTETLPLAVSVSLTSSHKALASRIRKVMQSAAFVNALQAIYDKYKLPNALQCLPTSRN